MRMTASGLNLRASVLFLLAAFTAAGWIALSFWFPDIGLTGLPNGLALILICNGILMLGIWQGLARTDFLPAKRVATWLAVAIPLALWIAVVWGLALNGTFRSSSGANRVVPALPLAIFLPVVVGLGLLYSSKTIASVLDATPPSWLIGLQVYRVLGGIFLVNWALGTMPGAFALPAGIGDVAVGLLALPTALWVTSATPIGRKVGTWWNLLGLTDFAVAIAMGMMTSPGPFQRFALDHPNVQLGTFPTVMIPAFAVPNSILLHALSLRQLKRSGKIGANDRTFAQAEPRARVAESA
jgi:hypothetical protein